MKIAVICANGKEGKLIVEEAIARGADVTAVADLEGFDVVIDAFGAWTPETLPQHGTSLKHLCDLVSGRETRLLVVGGAGSLYVNPEHTLQVMDGADFPDIFTWGRRVMSSAPEPMSNGPMSALPEISRQTGQEPENTS